MPPLARRPGVSAVTGPSRQVSGRARARAPGLWGWEQRRGFSGDLAVPRRLALEGCPAPPPAAGSQNFIPAQRPNRLRASRGAPVLTSPHTLVRTPSRGAASHSQAGIFQLWGDTPIPGVCPPGNLAAGISELGYPNAGPGHAAAPREILMRLSVTNTGEAKLQKGDKGVCVQAQVASLGTDPKWASLRGALERWIGRGQEQEVWGRVLPVPTPAWHTGVCRGLHLLVFWSSLGWMFLGVLESTFFRPPAAATHPSSLGPGEKRGRLSSCSVTPCVTEGNPSRCCKSGEKQPVPQ